MISIIVPVYNSEMYLENCIDSIINQTIKDIELILVNDGSTDGSKEICESYLKRDNRLKLINQENKGAAAARNNGIKNSSGDYIGFVDSDDFVTSGMYENMLRMCTMNNAEIAVCGTVDLDDMEKDIKLKNSGNYTVYSRDKVLKNMNTKESVYNYGPCNKLYKKEIFEKITFPEGIIYEDLAIATQIVYYSNRIVVTDDVFYCCYLSPKSVMRSEFSKKNLDILKAIEIKVEFLKNTEMKKLYMRSQLEYLLNLGDIYVSTYFSKIPEKDECLKYVRDKRRSFKSLNEVNDYFTLKVRLVDIMSFNFPHILRLKRKFI